MSLLTVLFCVSQAQCQEVRKRKELELQILTEAIRSWEGDDIKTLGNVVYMSQVMIQCAGSEVLLCECAVGVPSHVAEWVDGEGREPICSWTNFVLVPVSKLFSLEPLKYLG